MARSQLADDNKMRHRRGPEATTLNGHKISERVTSDESGFVCAKASIWLLLLFSFVSSRKHVYNVTERNKVSGALKQRQPCARGQQLAFGPLAAAVALLLAAVSLLALKASARPQHYYGSRYLELVPNTERQLPLNHYVGQNLNQFNDEQEANNGLYGPQRRDDLDDELEDDDDGDQSAAASYQNEDNDGGPQPGAAQDGYGENDPEPDAAYEETPNEQEGQADLERFFDDHLGASERDGMDKENLPSNLVRALAEPTKTQRAIDELQALASSEQQLGRRAPPPRPIEADERKSLKLGANFEPTIETTRSVRLPESGNKLIITHQMITRKHQAAVRKPLKNPPLSIYAEDGADAEPSKARGGKLDDGAIEHYGWDYKSRTSDGGARNSARSKETPQASGAPQSASSNIQLTEDDNFERVFVTNATNEPFRIAALGGYDPEQDFQEAAAEIDGKLRAPADDAKEEDSDESNRDEAPEESRPQIGGEILTLEEPQSEPLNEDASATDEVTFGREEPYQTDLEAEMRQQEFDKVGQFLASSQGAPNRDTKVAAQLRSVQHGAAEAATGDDNSAPDEQAMLLKAASQAGRPARLSTEMDSDEGAWVNDGVEDMDIPSQSHQNMILDKAAKQAQVAAAQVEASNQQADAAAASGVPEPLLARRGSQRHNADEQAHSSELGELDEDEDNSLDDEGASSQRRSRQTAGAREVAPASSATGSGHTSSSSSSNERDDENEGSQQMPNANYLRSYDLVDDD